jgi:hypothetical protein
MLHFMVQALKEPPLCSSTVLSCYPSLFTWRCAQESDQFDIIRNVLQAFLSYSLSILLIFSKMSGWCAPKSKFTLYQEYHSVCPFVRIGTPPTPSSPSKCVPSPESKGGRHTRLRVRGRGGPNSDDWRKGLALCLLWDVHVDLGHFDVQTCWWAQKACIKCTSYFP